MERHVRRPAEFRRAKPPFYEYDEEAAVREEEDYIEDYQPLPDQAAITESLLLEISLEPARSASVEVSVESFRDHRNFEELVTEKATEYLAHYLRSHDIAYTELDERSVVLRPDTGDVSIESIVPRVVEGDDQVSMYHPRSIEADDRVEAYAVRPVISEDFSIEGYISYWLRYLVYYGTALEHGLYSPGLAPVDMEVSAHLAHSVSIDDRETTLLSRVEVQDMTLSMNEVAVSASPDVVIREMRHQLIQDEPNIHFSRSIPADADYQDIIARAILTDNEANVLQPRAIVADDSVSEHIARTQETDMDAAARQVHSEQVDLEQRQFTPSSENVSLAVEAPVAADTRVDQDQTFYTSRVIDEQPHVDLHQVSSGHVDLEAALSHPRSSEGDLDVGFHHPASLAAEIEVHWHVPGSMDAVPQVDLVVSHAIHADDDVSLHISRSIDADESVHLASVAAPPADVDVTLVPTRPESGDPHVEMHHLSADRIDDTVHIDEDFNLDDFVDIAQSQASMRELIA